ncbi:methionine--tRNA ligase [Methanorbis furvi]|uniref:Methionine--tRNA ligase n=1 Tax=Methanorbis furvi TaxID=3028299 RepID=A0AAE4MC54_9EURY|nr:Methionine--tRNA ligase [Methanocorpusculaceae archaeon Ag1]
MTNKPTVVTCGLPYTNGLCHLGHLRTYIPGDFYVRYLRRLGDDIVFICGSDNHGTPIVVTAEAEHTTPRAVSEHYHAHFDEVFKAMEIRFDRFGMTDDPTNHNRTTSILKTLIEKGYVYEKTIQQSYCPNCKRFLPDRYVEGTCPYCGKHARGDECDQGCGRHLEPGEILDPVCATCGTKAELREQKHYYFKLSEFRDYLIEYLPTLEGTINARNYAIGWVENELKDWCITRMMDWGVKFPSQNAEGLVCYVWVDAPIGYISFTEEWAAATGGSWQKYWCEGDRVHFIGSDIIYHHCVFWPAMLHGAGYQPPSAVVASGMVTIDGQKFSKSRGYVVWTQEDYLEKGLPADYLRYYLLAYTSHTRELDFSWKEFQARINNELVNTFGNFANRSMTLVKTKFGDVPDVSVAQEIFDEIAKTLASVEESVRAYEFKAAVDGILLLAGYGNSYISNAAPWKLVKEDPAAAAVILKNCLQIVKACALLIQPVMPDSAQKLWAMLGYADEVESHPIADALVPFENKTLGDISPLFARIEDKQREDLEATLAKRAVEAQNKAAGKSMIDAEKVEIEPFSEEIVSIDDVAKLDLRVGLVVKAEKVPKTEKLLRLQVDVGTEVRQIVSSIALEYTPEEMVGKKIIVIVNLKPAKFRGEESNGMLFAAGESASLLVPLRDVAPGTKIH